MEEKNHLFDKRLTERNLMKGIISQKDYERFLKDLPDLKEKYEEDSLSKTPSPATPEKD
jgi:hypothetical protein